MTITRDLRMSVLWPHLNLLANPIMCVHLLFRHVCVCTPTHPACAVWPDSLLGTRIRACICIFGLQKPYYCAYVMI
jgi:hypothetical protein